jgi:hypothetical protein
MSNKILLTEIETELEKVKNLISSGKLDDVRRSRIANQGVELEEPQKQFQNKTGDATAIGERFRSLKELLRNI